MSVVVPADPSAIRRRFLAYRERMHGPSIFLDTVEGTTLQIIQTLKSRWPNAYRDNRIDLVEVAGA